MPTQARFSIVVPTRDAPEGAVDLVRRLSEGARRATFEQPLQVVLLVNDTRADHGAMQAAVQGLARTGFELDVLFAPRDCLTVEENIRETLVPQLDRVGPELLIIGNSDEVHFAELGAAIEQMRTQELDLLLVGVANRETFAGRTIRELCATPPHVSGGNRWDRACGPGPRVFRDALLDYGPYDYLAYIGCHLYTREMLRAAAAVRLSEPLYSIPLSVLEVTERTSCRVGSFPGRVVTRIDRLQFGPDSGRHPEDWWVTESRVRRGLSPNIFLSVVSSSLDLCESAFDALVQSRMVSSVRGESKYVYWSVLTAIGAQLAEALRAARKDDRQLPTAAELLDVNRFAVRLEAAALAWSGPGADLFITWLRSVGGLAETPVEARAAVLRTCVAFAPKAIALLDARPGGERWIARRQGSSELS